MPLASVSELAAPIDPPSDVAQDTLTCSAGSPSLVTSTWSGWLNSTWGAPVWLSPLLLGFESSVAAVGLLWPSSLLHPTASSVSAAVTPPQAAVRYLRIGLPPDYMDNSLRVPHIGRRASAIMDVVRCRGPNGPLSSPMPR